MYTDDHFRARFLHGREGMLKACAQEMKRLQNQDGLVWVDLGGGTGQNVETMARFFDISQFEKIYVVDICGPLCEMARKNVKQRGWTNVEVFEADVCEFKPETAPATLITFSYSLSSKYTSSHCMMLNQFIIYLGLGVLTPVIRLHAGEGCCKSLS